MRDELSVTVAFQAGEPVLRSLGLPFDWHQQPHLGPFTRSISQQPLHHKMSTALGNRFQAYLPTPRFWTHAAQPDSQGRPSAESVKVETPMAMKQHG